MCIAARKFDGIVRQGHEKAKKEEHYWSLNAEHIGGTGDNRAFIRDFEVNETRAKREEINFDVQYR